MFNLKIFFTPYYKNIAVPIEESLFRKILRQLNKRKTNLGKNTLNIPEIGFQGFELISNNYETVFFHDQDIILTYNNISSLYLDKKKSFYYLILRKILKKNYNELKYFIEIEYLNNKKFKE
jgi:hypothetical protein